MPLLGERGWEFSFWAPAAERALRRARGARLGRRRRPAGVRVQRPRLAPAAGARRGGCAHAPATCGATAPSCGRAARRSCTRTRSSPWPRRWSPAAAASPTVLHVHEMLPLDLRGRMLRRAAWRRLDQVVAVSRPCAERLSWRGHRPRIVYEATPMPPRPSRDPRPPAPVHGRDRGRGLARARAATCSSTPPPGCSSATAPSAFRFEMVGAAHDAVQREWASEVLARARDVGIHHIPSAECSSASRQWDAFVLPSRADPFPISMLEAMASGLPVVGTRRDGIVEQIADGTGLLIEPETRRARRRDRLVRRPAGRPPASGWAPPPGAGSTRLHPRPPGRGAWTTPTGRRSPNGAGTVSAGRGRTASKPPQRWIRCGSTWALPRCQANVGKTRPAAPGHARPPSAQLDVAVHDPRARCRRGWRRGGRCGRRRSPSGGARRCSRSRSSGGSCPRRCRPGAGSRAAAAAAGSTRSRARPPRRARPRPGRDR